jgi:hypothetical protein
MIRLTENWRDSLRIFLSLLSLAGLQLLLTMHLRMKFEPVADVKVQASERLNPALFQSMAFGQLPASIDWVWLKSLQDPSLERVKKGEHLQVYYDLDLLTDLDPLFINAYVVGANVLAVVHNDGLGALSLLLKGEKFRQEELPKYSESFRNRFWEEGWSVPLLLGYTYLFEMDDLPRAAEAYEAASRIPGSPEYLQHLVMRFKQPGGVYEVGLKLTEFLIGSAPDVRTKEKLLQRREALLVGQYLFEADRQFQSFLDHKKILRSGTPSPLELAALKKLWREFLQQGSISETDPWSGTLTVGDNGRVITSTPHQKVLGLE